MLCDLTGLKQAARGSASQSPGQVQAEVQREPSPFDGLAAKMGLPTNCDIDLRRQEDLEVYSDGDMPTISLLSTLFKCVPVHVNMMNNPNYNFPTI